MKEEIKTEMIVKELKVGVIHINNEEYISLTDLARFKDKDRTDYIIQNWMRTTNSILYLGNWELIYNVSFKPIEFDGFKKESGSNSFVMTPKKWIENTNAKGIVMKRGRNGGTYAHSDIAFEFASWIDPVFKLYLIKEFQRLKKDEAYRNKLEWHASRLLTKANYLVHTDSIKNNIVPTLTEKQKRFIYQEEADVLNVALFGMTAKEWRDENPDIEKGNIRDYTDLLHLIILNNLENINAELIKMEISQGERLVKLNKIARNQMSLLNESKSFSNLNFIEHKEKEDK